VDKIVIQGGSRLEGSVCAGGAKNAALPLLFASLLTDEPCVLHNVPDVADIHTAVALLEGLGARVERQGTDRILLDCSGVNSWEAPYDQVRKMRASFVTLGPLLARFGRARVSTPGGCAIGSRPVDIHVSGLSRLGVDFVSEHGYVEGSVRSGKSLVGGHAILPMPSVGATENLLMAAVLATGTTRIENAAREPEVVDLADALTKMGARIKGAGSSVIEIEGVSRLGGFDHAVVCDRIVVGTYLIAGAITGGRVTVTDGRAAHLEAFLEKLTEVGCVVEVDDSGVGVTVSAEPGALRPTDFTTAPHPGFPTDLQAQLMALLCCAQGTSVVHEAIFENRFMHVQELVRMGAVIRCHAAEATVEGGAPLSGAPVMATDLRASVCLVLAGLAAEGSTEVLRIYHLDRGYERIEEKLSALGADIRRVPAESAVSAAGDPAQGEVEP
jgi:UDP-N-acetylglucosamine 1-carboxyvinyltransferase